MKLNEHITNHIVWSHSDNVSEIFERIFDQNLWQSTESVSGKGSEISAAQNLLDKLPVLLKKYNINTVTDAPCGDYHWAKHLDYKFEQYTGIDIVEKLIENNKKYETDCIKFLTGDIINCKLPQADLILCRDCFIHLTFEQIKETLKNFKASKSKYILTNTYDINSNTDVLTGQFRKINLLIPPFNFPEPLEIIEENHQDKKLIALWKQEDICL